MKVLLVSSIYPPEIGGPSAQTQKIAHGLVNRGIEAHVVTYGDPKLSGLIGGVPITFISTTSGRGLPSKVARNIHLYRQISQIIDKEKPSVVHMQMAAGPLAILTGISAKLRNVPSIVKYTADLAWEMSNRSKLIQESRSQNTIGHKISFLLLEFIEWFLFSIYNNIWSTTPTFRDRLIKHFQISSKKIWVLPNFIDLQPFEEVFNRKKLLDLDIRSFESSLDIKLLTVTRLKPWKGVDICIRAISHLRDLPVRLRIVGSGVSEYESYLRDLAEQLQVNDRVEFSGAVRPECIAEEYREADIFMLASYYEPFGIVLLEAMAAGLPIIASNTGGIPNVIEDGVSGYLVPVGDVQGLAAAVRTIITNRELRKSLVRAGKVRAKQFDFQRGLDFLVERYTMLTSDKSP